MTVQELIEKFNEFGALQCKLEIYGVKGNQYKFVEVYVSDDDNDVVCIDVERVE